MRRRGIKIGPAGGSEPHPRFETPPGLQLQFDWKESVRMANRDGEAFEFNVFSATLGYSRRHLFIRSNTRTADDPVRCMFLTIMRLGGVPREWVTDNMSALVVVKGGRRTRVERAWAFARETGFGLRLCRPRCPQTKGKVESSNRSLSRLMAYQGDFDDWVGPRRNHRPRRGALQLRGQRDHGHAPVGTVPAGEGRAAAGGQRPRPRGGDGRRRAGGQGAGHDARVGPRRGDVGAEANLGLLDSVGGSPWAPAGREAP